MACGSVALICEGRCRFLPPDEPSGRSRARAGKSGLRRARTQCTPKPGRFRWHMDMPFEITVEVFVGVALRRMRRQIEHLDSLVVIGDPGRDFLAVVHAPVIQITKRLRSLPVVQSMDIVRPANAGRSLSIARSRAWPDVAGCSPNAANTNRRCESTTGRRTRLRSDAARHGVRPQSEFELHSSGIRSQIRRRIRALCCASKRMSLPLGRPRRSWLKIASPSA